MRIRYDGVPVLFEYSGKENRHIVYIFRISETLTDVRKFEKLIHYKELILCNQDGQINFGRIRDRFQLSKSGEAINAIYLMETQNLIRVREVGSFFFAERWSYSFSRIFCGDSIESEITEEGETIALYMGGVEIGQFGPFSKGVFQNPFVRNQAQRKLMVH